jgi:hypothetical protein
MDVRMDGWMVEWMNRWLLRIDGHISGCAEWHAISIPRFYLKALGSIYN